MLHARGISGDAALLVEAAERFAALDCHLLAAEAASAATAGDALPRRERTRVAAFAASERALSPLAVTPGLATGPSTAGLTARERQIAQLAAGGRSSKEIAEALVLSVRTVDNHLANVYTKLGITGRDQLTGDLS